MSADKREQPPRLTVAPLETPAALRDQVRDALRDAIMRMDIYGQDEEIRLDERQLCADLGVSRTPIREALSSLEQEGFVRSTPRRGIRVVRKTRRDIVEMITVWAAIESMAAALAVARATDAEIAGAKAILARFDDDPSGRISEYSEANMAFHKAIIRMGGIALMTTLTDTLFAHMRAVRAVTMTQDNRARRSIADHRAIVAALEARDADRVMRLVRDHTMGLAAHVERYGDFLDPKPIDPKPVDPRPAAAVARPSVQQEERTMPTMTIPPSSARAAGTPSSARAAGETAAPRRGGAPAMSAIHGTARRA